MTTRRLAAILAADVVSFSTMMEKDEEGTLEKIKALQRVIIEPKVTEHHGRIVKTTGDGFLVEFASPVEAVRCATAIQDALKSGPLQLRIGINLGDIIIEADGDVYGDGVNIAARLEGFADPGGVCISGAVYDQIEGKIDRVFESRGEQQVKNIARPVRLYALQGSMRTSPTSISAPLLPDKPSIAVLPFTNLTDDQGDQYFADGITEDLITALSRIRWFRVVARSSAFGYKPPPTRDIRQIARDFGARYLLEGSVRKAGDRVRLTAQLIDGDTTHQIWTKRYDREASDIFAMQDDLTESLIAAVEPELDKAERDRARAKRPENLNAWDLHQRGLWHLYKRNRDDLAEAERLFQQALESDPSLVPALCAAAEVHVLRVLFGFADDPAFHRREALRLARSAVELDDQDARAQCTLGRAYSASREHEAAIPHLKAAIALNPSFAWAQYLLGMAYTYSGQAHDGIPHLELAIKQNPHDPYVSRFMACLAEAYLFLGDDERAVEWAQQSLRQATAVHYTGHTALAAALGHLGRTEEASRVSSTLHDQWPNFSLGLMARSFSLKHPPYWARYLEGLKKAGLVDASDAEPAPTNPHLPI